jgi:hypothetical protein
LGLDCIFDKDKKDVSLDSLYKYNYYPSVRNAENLWRIYAVNDEGGTIICSFPPTIKKHNIPIPYFQECMTGFEYSLAGLMIAEGKQDKGETLVKAVRDRFNGENRNPYNEIECGNNYARAMSSYALLPIYSGFTFDMTKNYIGFNPIIKGDTIFAWSINNSWGTVEFSNNTCTLKVLGNPICLKSFGVNSGFNANKVIIDGNATKFSVDGNIINFEKTYINSELIITL